MNEDRFYVCGGRYQIIMHQGDWNMGQVVVRRLSPSSGGSPDILLPAELFKEVAAKIVREARIEKIEGMSDNMLLYGKER